MKKHSPLKRVGAMMLTLAMLVGMLSVCGTFSFAASAETAGAEKFVADFSELAALGGDLVTQDGYATAYTPSTDNATADGKMNNWMREKFATKTNYVYSTYRSWFSQLSDEISDKETTGWGGNGSTTGLRVHPDGLMQRVENVYATEMLRRVDTIIPQFNGENVQLKNFKATIKYRTRLQNYRGAIVVGFDETDAGYNVATNSTYLGTRRTVTGATLVLGNGSGNGKRGDGNGAAEKDGWVFYNRTGVISSTTVDEKRNDSVWHDLKLGETEGDFTVAGGQVMYKRFDTDSTQQWMTLTVEVKNGKATFTTTSEDGYRNETMEMAYNPRGGYFSIGMSDRDYIINYVDIVEYDENGNEVDFGTYHSNAVEVFSADFTDLPDLHYVNGQYLYNVNHDPSTGKGVGLTGSNGATATSVAAYATSYKVDVKDKALVDYLESKFDFYINANGGGGTFPMWNAAGYVVDAEGNPLGAGFASSNPHNPSTGVAGGGYMPGSGQGGFAMNGYYPTMTLSGNKWFHIASDIGINARNPFDIVYSYALNNANGDKAVVKNFQLDLDFKLTHPGEASYPHNQSPVFVKFGGYDSVKSSGTDGAMFAISHNGGYFLDDLSTGFTAGKNSDGSPAYTEYIGGAARTQIVEEAHLTLTVKNGTVNAVVTLADGTEVLNVTKNDISIQNGLIYIGTTYAGMNHGLPYFGAVKVVRLDADGNPIDFTDGDEDTFNASFVGLTEVVDTCYYRDLGTKNNNILTGKANPWLSNATSVSSGYAFDGNDANIVNYLNEKFEFYHTDLTGKVHAMPTPYTTTEELQADRWAPTAGRWALSNGNGLRAVLGAANGELFRKSLTVVPKMNGEAIVTSDFEMAFDYSIESVRNGIYYPGGVALNFRSAEKAVTKDNANTVTLVFTREKMVLYDNVAPDYTYNDVQADEGALLWNSDNTNVGAARVKISVLGDTMSLKVTSTDGATELYSNDNIKLSRADAGYVYLTALNSDVALGDIEITPVPVAPEWIEGLPTYAGGYNDIVAGRNDTKTFVIEGTNADTFNTYRASVEAAGWTKVSENDAADNLFATYQKDGQAVYMYYLAAENRVHVVKMEANAVLPSAAADYNKVCDPLFTQVQLSYATASEGMSYLVRLSDGRFIVIDGGDDEADYLESKHLYNLMQEQNVLDKITVAAWIITHAHGDHQLVPTEFMNYYTADDLTIEQVVFNYPTVPSNEAQTTAFLAAVDAWAASGTKRVTPYIGQEFNFADAKIEFLHTIDAYAPGQIDGADFNNTSSVFTIEIAGQKIMILGDMHTIGNDQLVKLYGEYLKSDIVQFNHHGVGGGTREVYVAIDPAVVMNPAGVFHHTNTYNYYRYHAPADDRTAQAFKWLYYPENDETNHVKEVFLMGFKEVTLTLPYTSAEGCTYMANRNNNGYVFEEAAASDATVPEAFYELDLGEATDTVYYNGEAYEVVSKRVEKGAAVETYTVEGLADVLNGNNSFELFVAIDELPNVLTGETFYMFGTATNGLTLENNTLNVSLRRGSNTAVQTSGGRYYRGNVVGGKVVNHIVGTYNAETGVLSVYENGVLIQSGTYAEGFTAENVLNLGSTQMNGMSGYTVLGARVYDAALTDEQVAAAYWNAINGMKHTCEFTIGNYDANGHWTECACGETTEVVPHVFDNDCDTDCACGYTREITHNYATTEYDDNGHWTKCACGATTEVVPHEFDSACDTDCACGYTREITHNYATPKFDADNHWNECECGEKADVTAHTMNVKFNEEGHWTACDCGYATAMNAHEMRYVVDGDKHYEACDCGYTTTPVDHDFTDGDCVCGEEKPQEDNTAVADEETKIITVKAGEGYELKAGSLLVKDAEGNYFVPTRVGFREDGNADQYKIPANAVAPYTVRTEFYQPTLDDLNMGIVGASTNEQESGLRFVYRLNVIREGDKMYMLADGTKVEVAEYGMILAAKALWKGDPNNLTLEKALESMHIQEPTWPAKDVYYDTCDEYVDIAVHIKGIAAANAQNAKFITRTFVKLADGTVVYTDPVAYSYNDFQA